MKTIILFLTFLALISPQAQAKSNGQMNSGEAALSLIFFPFLLVQNSQKKVEPQEETDTKKEIKEVPVRGPAMVGIEEYNKKIEKGKE